MLYICATPIGNLEDITLRVLRVLKEVDLIIAEDTRQTKKILSYYQIANKLVSLHKYNEHAKSDYLISLLEKGKELALVSDAGMPGISDPGVELIQKVIAAKLPFTVLPGASAVTTAVVQSGLLTGPFYFYGFLSRKQKQVNQALTELASITCPLIFYEAPHRLLATLKALEQNLGNRKCAVSRELTKMFEETRRGYLSDMIDYYSYNQPRGEFVITVAGYAEKAGEQRNLDDIDIQQQLMELISRGMTKKEAVKEVAKQLGVSRNEIYQLALDLPVKQKE